MQGEQVVLTDMLQCRERRAQIQDTFIEQYHCPVISFCMNSVEIHEKTGDELLLAIDCPAEKIKNLTTEIEETHPIGRLFDMDVIDTDGQKLSRPSYRKCIICGCQAQECARTRKHTVEEMQAKIEEMLSAE